MLGYVLVVESMTTVTFFCVIFYIRDGVGINLRILEIDCFRPALEEPLTTHTRTLLPPAGNSFWVARCSVL